MKRYSVYILLLIAGVVLGWLVFGNSESASLQRSTHPHIQSSNTPILWTCAMHPQIMQPEPGDCPICGMDLIPAESSADGLAMNEIKMTKNAMVLANVQTAIVGNASADNENMISLSGKIKMNEEENAIQASYFEGRIERLNINFEGQEVRKGQLLATIYAPNLVAAQQELIAAASVKASQPVLYRAVRNKLKLWKLSDQQIHSIEQSAKVQVYFPIYATVSGTVSEVVAKEGDYVKRGQPMLKVSDLSSVWAAFDAYEHQIVALKKGQAIKVTTNAYANTPFNAKVSFIAPVLNSTTRTVTVRATLTNKDGLFKPGMFVTGKLNVTKQRTDGDLTIPASAVLWTGERSLVYVKTHSDAPIFEMREVTLGFRNGETFTIHAGLTQGDEIVTNGTFTVDAAAQLQGKKSMMNKGKQETTAAIPPMKMQFSKSFQSEFKSVIASYLQMKDALVAGNTSDVSAFATATAQKLSAIKTNDLGKMEKLHVHKSSKMLDAIATNQQIETQRNHFVILNQNIVPIVMHIDTIDPKIYIQKCPMVNNNTGAYWLSTERKIRNPYYGDAMLTCGSVIDTMP